MSHGPRSTRVQYPLQAADTAEAPGTGFYATTEYAYLGERMPVRANNQPNVSLLSRGIAAAYVGGARLSFIPQRASVYRRLVVPSNATGQK